MQYNIITQSDEETVVAEYEPEARKSGQYQSEAELERQFISLLQEQGYEYLDIRSERELIENLRKQLEAVNGYVFSDNEWDSFFNSVISNPNANSIEDKTRLIQEDFRQTIRRDDGTSKNISLIDKSNIHNNRLQVINQYENAQGRYENRYDVTILVNGLPLVHVELKRRGMAIKEAFNQINRYERDSFWAGCGLYNFVQLFVISNGTNTKYYSNTTRRNHIADSSRAQRRTKTSNSFEFTSFWADSRNRTIPDLVDFAKTFFARRTLLNILTRYCVFTTDKMLLVMRPYQIAATERILNRIEISTNYKKYGTLSGGGYVWHTTGSGKTLTSFKTAQLASRLDYIDKVVFVVDRRDLDYQTMREYDKFEKGCANSNRNTVVLQKQLEDSNCKIIITTIQKLSIFISKNKSHSVYDKHVVLIFDECHRSQFGQMHKAIVKSFRRYHVFGFTGTPILSERKQRDSAYILANEFKSRFSGTGVANGNGICLATTEQAFGDRLHTYTIVNAINDCNVLPFRVDYVRTMELPDEIQDKDVYDIDRERAYSDPKRISLVVRYVLEHFNQKTYRNNKWFKHNIVANISEVAAAGNRRNVAERKETKYINGFNSIFAVSSISAAKSYYSEFKRQMLENPQLSLSIGLIYSYGVNDDETDGIIDDENIDSTDALAKPDRDFLEESIGDYNKKFLTNFDTSPDRFQNYYKDVSLRMKNRELDLLIVVNMFLTGFDATTLNTLWVDKNLRMHGLLQAFSRTNRIFNSVKTFGNIICFRNLQSAVDESISIFSDEDISSVVLLKGFRDYYYGFEDKNGKRVKGYEEMINELKRRFSLNDGGITGDQNKKNFIMLFSAILKLRNILASFDEFAGNEILTERDFQDYCSRYLDLRDELKSIEPKKEAEKINDDIVFEIELIKQVEINIDYILALIEKYHDSNCKDREIRISISKAIDSSIQLRSKKELIENFVGILAPSDDVMASWHAYVETEKERELSEIIKTEKLKEEETRRFVKNSFESGQVKTTGTDIDELMPKTSRFFGGNRDEKKRNLIAKLLAFFEKFFGVTSPDTYFYSPPEAQEAVMGEEAVSVSKVAQEP